MGTAATQRYESESRHDGFSWRPRADSVQLLFEAKRILDASPRPMTVRQLYYRLVAALLIPNNIRSYQNLVGMLTKARKVDLLDTDKFVDRARATVEPVGYANLDAYLDLVSRAYRRHPNDGQPHYVEVWTEKDALSAIIGDVIQPYGATLVVSKGYSSYTLLVEAARRFAGEVESRGADHCHLLYFGDFDPSGEDIFRVISSEMDALTGEPIVSVANGGWLHIQKIALTRDLIDEHRLPPMPTKTSDSRSDGFRAQHGDIAVELDALPPETLEEIVRDAVLEFFDKEIRRRILKEEAVEVDEIKKAVDEIQARRGRQS